MGSAKTFFFLKIFLFFLGHFKNISYLCIVKQLNDTIMSNSKVRKQIEAKEAKGKVLEAYKKKTDFILDYQVCKAYFKDSALSIMAIVEKILKAKYNLPWQEKIIRKVLQENRGKSNPTIAIPQFKYEKNVHDIISEYVIRNFDRIVTDYKNQGSGVYPLRFLEVLEKFS